MLPNALRTQIRVEQQRLTARRQRLTAGFESTYQKETTTMKTEAELKAAAAAAGIDWATLIQFLTTQGLPFIMALIQIFAKKPPVTKAVASCTPEELAADLKAHFDCIAAVAKCGADCCNC